MNKKSLAWALVTATATVTTTGVFVPELGLAVASTALGGAALIASFLARRSVAGYSGIKRTKEIQLQKG